MILFPKVKLLKMVHDSEVNAEKGWQRILEEKNCFKFDVTKKFDGLKFDGLVTGRFLKNLANHFPYPKNFALFNCIF